MICKKRTAPKVTAILLALMMAVVFMPTLSFAAKKTADEQDTITVFMTVSDQGKIAKTKDNQDMAWKRVNVSDVNEDGKYSFDEALVAAHAAYNAPEGYSRKSSGWVTSLWGNSTAPGFSFFQNDERTDLVTEAFIEDGDDLVASINRDGELYADWAAAFDTHQTMVAPGEEFDLTLTGFPAMTTNDPIPGEDVQIGEWKNGSFAPIEGAVTNEDGKVSLSFDEPGTYIITADGKTSVPDLVNAGDYPQDEGLWKLMTMGTYEGKRVYGKMDYDTGEMWYAYTESDYGDNPCPWKEIKYDPYDEFDDIDDFVESVDGYPVYTGIVSTDCPIIAPCCVVEVCDAADVTMTVNNKGILAKDKNGEAMADVDVRAWDLDGDKKITYDEALIAAHEEYFADGADGYSAPGGWVSKLWGVETGNTLFCIDNESISPSLINEATVESGDALYASVNKDDRYYADFMSFFDDADIDIEENGTVNLTLYGFKGMGMGDELIPKALEGIQIGYWKDGEFEAIEGAVTDEQGKASFLPEEAGEYLVSAQGTVRATVTDWFVNPPAQLEADCPIMAPFCFLSVKESGNKTFEETKAAAAKDLFEEYDLSKYRLNEQIQVLGTIVAAQAKIMTANNMAEVKAAVEDAKKALDGIKTDAQYKQEEAAQKAEQEKAQKAQIDKVKSTAVAGVKAKAAKKKRIRVSWTPDATFDGYQISYAKGKKVKTVKVAGATASKKVIKNLKKGKKYTVKVRGYKNIGGAVYYGPWASAAKKVKVK